MLIPDEMEAVGLTKCTTYHLMNASNEFWTLWRKNKEDMKAKGYTVFKAKGQFYVLAPTTISDT